MDKDKKTIDWEVLEPLLGNLKKQELVQLLRRAYQVLPASAVVSVFGSYVDLTSSQQDVAPQHLLEAVQSFYDRSMAGRYFESFRVNSKNFMDMSEGTERWISECNHLFDECVLLSTAENATSIHLAMELLFELLAEIDRGSDKIIFFADEAGSWQVGIDVEKVLPAYFTCLAAVAKPPDYARKVRAIIQKHGSYVSEKLLDAARIAGNHLQRQSLAK